MHKTHDFDQIRGLNRFARVRLDKAISYLNTFQFQSAKSEMTLVEETLSEIATLRDLEIAQRKEYVSTSK